MGKGFLWPLLWRRIFVFAQSASTYHTVYGCYDTVLVLKLIIPINDISGTSRFDSVTGNGKSVFTEIPICKRLYYATFARQDLESDRTKCNYVFIFYVILIPLFKFFLI